MASVTAEVLSKKACIGPEIKNYAQETLQLINDQLMTYPCKYGKNTLTVKMPMIFETYSLSIEDAQKAVYYLIIINLKKRGFGVELTFYKNKRGGDIKKIEIHISWESKINLEELQKMEGIIKNCSTIVNEDGKPISK